MALSGPVSVQGRGRDVAVVLSPEEFRAFRSHCGHGQPRRPGSHAESAKRWAKVFETLAK